MDQNRMCPNCHVHVSSDLRNCPLCGKHLVEQAEEINANERSYPIYNFKPFQNLRWFNVIRVMFWVAAFISVIINLCFMTKPLWFPYVLAALVMVFHVFISPIKVTVKSYIKDLTIMSVLVSLFVIFIDAYNHYSFNITFGWALSYAGPFIMMAAIIASSIICLSSKTYERELFRSVIFMAVFSVIYFLVVYFGFPKIAAWPSLSFMCVSIAFVAVLQVFKRNRLMRELKKEFHI